MSTLKQRFAMLRTERPDITQADLARATGAKPPSVNAWFSGETKSMKGSTAAKAAQLYGCNPLWLSDGEGAMWPGGSRVSSAGAPTPAVGQPSIQEALDSVVAAIAALSPDERAALVKPLAILAEAPDSQEARRRVLAILLREPR